MIKVQFTVHNPHLVPVTTQAAIGGQKVDKWFYADLDQNYLHRITGTIDPINKLFFWSYPGAGNSGGTSSFSSSGNLVQSTGGSGGGAAPEGTPPAEEPGAPDDVPFS